MGIDGLADVLAIEPCPEIEAGRGRVITGTFTTARCSVLELRLSNGEVLEPTRPHRFYSDTRQDWVAAGELRVGECLRTASGQAVTVESVGLKAGEYQVYNLEVEQEHQFYVGETALLVHNAYPQKEFAFMEEEAAAEGGLVPYNSTKLSRSVVTERELLGLQSSLRNGAAVEYQAGGLTRVKVMFSEFGKGHSEELLDAWLAKNGIQSDQVTGWYSEREPCNWDDHMCGDLLATKYPSAPVTWSVPFNTAAEQSVANSRLAALLRRTFRS